jgi:hypothetical protein
MSVTVLERPIGHVLGSSVSATIDEQYGGYATVNKVAHGLSDGDYVYIESNIESYNGFWYVNIEGADYFKFRRYASDTDQDFIVNADITYYEVTTSHGVSSVHLPITYRLRSDLSVTGTTIVTDTLTNSWASAVQESTANEDWTASPGMNSRPRVNLVGNENSEEVGFAFDFTSGQQYDLTQSIDRINSGGGTPVITVYVRLYDSFGGGTFNTLRGEYSYTFSNTQSFSITPSGNASYIVFYITQTGGGAINNTLTLDGTTISYEVPVLSTVTVSSFNDDNGYTNITLSNSIDSGSYPEPYEYLKIDGGLMDGVYQIIEVISPTCLTLNLVYNSTYSFTGGLVYRHYNNYNILVRVYGGLGSSHAWYTKKPYELLSTLKLIPDSNGEVFFSVNEILKSQIETRNNLTLDTLPNNLDFFTCFYIAYAESYDDSLGSQYILSTYTSDFTDDIFEGMAANSKLPFKNIHSGYMSEYVGGAKFLTLFDSIKLTGGYQDISILIDDNDNDYEIDISGSQTAIEAYDKGVYRLPISATGVYSIYKSDVKVSEDLTVSSDSECSNQSIVLSWLNYLGGMEYFNFTAEKEYQIEIEDSGETTVNHFVNWPNSYGKFADTLKKQTFRKSRKATLVRSQYLTQSELEAIQYIKTSPLVQVIDSRTDRRTVIVDSDSFTVRKDRQDLFEISFTINNTDEVSSQ